jgi:hypothetical protein
LLDTGAMEAGNPFFSWLAAQPAFVEVGLGILFCLLIAPALLALVARGLTAIEESVGRVLTQSGMLTPDAGPALHGKWDTLKQALTKEIALLRRALTKPNA